MRPSAFEPPENHDIVASPSTASDAGYWLEKVELAVTLPAAVMFSTGPVGEVVVGVLVVVVVVEGDDGDEEDDELWAPLTSMPGARVMGGPPAWGAGGSSASG